MADPRCCPLSFDNQRSLSSLIKNKFIFMFGKYKMIKRNLNIMRLKAMSTNCREENN